MMNAEQKAAAIAVLKEEVENATTRNLDERMQERIQQAIEEIERMETTEETPAE
jgi:DNA repair exonuclease SbcCD nuclease subunit